VRRPKKNKKPFALIFLVAMVAVGVGLQRLGFVSPSQKQPTSETAASGNLGTAPCNLIHVVDGDTITARYRGKKESIRLLRINTPERGREGYREARDALRDLVEGTELTLEFENPHRIERDRYGRILAYVIADGINANVEIVRQGWSRFWKKYGTGRFSAAFEGAEHEARQNTAGLWSDRGWN
jgi:endonuclease YncB( thermonuclease family)